MRECVKNWKHKKGGHHWEPFLECLRGGVISDEEYKYIEKNSDDNFIRHSQSHFDPVRLCLNAVHEENIAFCKDELQKIDQEFFNLDTRINIKIFLNRISEYYLADDFFEKFISLDDNVKRTKNFNKQASASFYKVASKVVEIANQIRSNKENKNMEQKFQEWLKLQKSQRGENTLGEVAVNDYVKVLRLEETHRHADKYSPIKIRLEINSFYDIQDVSLLSIKRENINDIMPNNDGYNNLTDDGGLLNAALNHYQNFLQQKIGAGQYGNNDIEQKFIWLIKKSHFFSKLKADESFLLEQLNKIDSKSLKAVRDEYKEKLQEKKAPINALRFEITKCLINNQIINWDSFETLKEEVAKEYKKNVFQGWKRKYNILHVLFFNPEKEKIQNCLKNIFSFLETDIGFDYGYHYNDFSGPQHQGYDHCWIGLYNSKINTNNRQEREQANQYYLGFKKDGFHWGAKNHSRPENNTQYTPKNQINKELIRKLISDIKQKADWINNKEYHEDNMKLTLSNQILYGPPGTGKTYSTVGTALEILGATDGNDKIKSIGKLKEAFGSQVEFVTFHQSFSYEDFVEGLKAKTDDGKITYEIEDGIFKEICASAQDLDNHNVDLTDLDLDFENYLKVGQTLKTQRGVEFEIIKIKPSSIKVKTSKGTEYPANISFITKSLQEENFQPRERKSYEPKIAEHIFNEIKANRTHEPQSTSQSKKPHVLIIDEINRGNISRIFGELITLIEPSKRAGESEEISVQLPYSKELFSVPNNLHIIGTMNTADRSLALMDTALRRRFDFIEMMPDTQVMIDKMESTIADGVVDLVKMLNKINQRIEVLYDREHTIGHSFLMKVNDLQGLKNAFKNKILPLLEEYFYDDWQKIRAVLNDRNDNFYQKIEPPKNLFLEAENNITDKTIYRRQNCDELTADAFIQIYTKS